MSDGREPGGEQGMGSRQRTDGGQGTVGDSARQELAERLRELRENSGRTYAALARRIGVSASTLHRYCTGGTVPAEFAPVERLAQLCGRTGEERQALHRLWLRADAERVERQESGAVEPAGGRETALAAAQPGTDAPRTEALSGSVPAAAAPVRPDEDRPVSGASAPRTASVRRWAPALVVCVAAALALALSAAFGDPSRPERPERSERPPSVAPPAAPPFTWTTDDHVWKYGCGHAYLVGGDPATVPAPPAEADAEAWARALDAVHAGETGVRITLQGTEERAVVLEALRVRVVERREPAAGRVHRMSSGCGGALTPRMFDVDLDVKRPLARSVPGNDTGEPIAAVSFPYRVSASDPEVLLVTARAAHCDCDWVAELRWSSGGRSGTVRIKDDGGRPFRTSGAPGRPVHDYDYVTRRWVAEPEGAGPG
ncbi:MULTISPECIES: helix-turn-helix transcriptional regulator [unclassified Streptomyces]|uniref:helix-turn-helix domain-containing protein n=1 Tax=unclassified Streptomyces TaxID=2593676 RepID=UPI0033B3C331